MKQVISAVCVLLLALTANAQPGSSQSANVVMVDDTVHYYFNKFYFKTGKGLNQLPYFSAPFSTSTLVAHLGVRFNNDEPIVISGIEAFAARDSASTKQTIPVQLYLCTLQNNLPVLPPLDYVDVLLSGDKKLKPIGGNFASGLSHTLTTDFALLIRNMSPYAGDYVLVGHNGAKTATNSTAMDKEKYGEGNGYVSYGGNFYSTTNSTITGGTGTDYEFCIAPRVQYTLTSDHVVAPNADSVCTFEKMVFTSLSSKRFLQHQYNLVEFDRKWNHNPPFAGNTLKVKMRTGPNPGDTLWVDVFPTDASVGWYFASEDNLQNNPDPRFPLPPNTTNNQITFYTDSAVNSLLTGGDSLTCFYTNEFRTRYKSMCIYGRGIYHQYNDTFAICTSFCGRDGVGLPEQNKKSLPGIYPNPSEGIFRIEGIKTGARLQVYNVSGGMIYDKNAGPETVVDLSVYPAGVYFVKTTDSSGEFSFRILKH